MRESAVEKFLVSLVRNLGGEVRKVNWVGRRGAPDRLVLLADRAFFIELKAPGKKPTAEQLREHERLRQSGLQVFVADSIVSVGNAVVRSSTAYD